MQNIIEQLKLIEHSFPIRVSNIRVKTTDEENALVSILMSVELPEPLSSLSRYVLITYIKRAVFQSGYLLRAIQIHPSFSVMSLEEIGTPNKKSA